MPTLKAVKSFRYLGQPKKPGDIYEATSQDANTHRSRGLAVLAGGYEMRETKIINPKTDKHFYIEDEDGDTIQDGDESGDSFEGLADPDFDGADR